MKHKKRIILLFTLLLCLVTLGLSIFTACDRKDGLGDETRYSVSVEYPDGTGVKDVTVTFTYNGKEYASEKTNASGQVQVTLFAGEYDVTLSDLPEGYSFEGGVKTNRLGTPLSLELTQRKTTYSATVTLPDGSKAEGVTVVWSKGDVAVAEVETDENGVASIQLIAGSYSVTLKNEPDGFWLEHALTATEQTCALNIALAVDPRVKFTVTANTEGGMPVKNVIVYVMQGTSDVLETKTGKDGTAVFRLLENDYTVLTVCNTPGLTISGKTTYSVNKVNPNVAVTLKSQVIDSDPPEGKKYVLGDVMYDFLFAAYDDEWNEDKDGNPTEPKNPLQLSNLLGDADGDGEQDNTLVVINFWYTTCSWCIKEFPCLIDAYKEYADKGVKVIAIDPMPSDTAAVITNFRQQYYSQFKFNFPIVRDSQLVKNFSLEGYPTTIFIDRYGAVARIDSGAITATELWTDLFEEFTAKDYRQTFEPGEEVSAPEDFVPDIPDVQMPASSAIEAAINNVASGFNFSYYPEEGTSDAKYAWPFVVGDDKDGKKVIVPANKGYRSSYSMIHTNMTLKAGDVVAFDFLSSTESSDILYVLVDGLVLWQISGVAEEWDTCYAYVALKDGTHKLTLLYMKDATVNSGDDVVYISNMRITTTDEIETTTDVLRECATDMNSTGTAYNDYVTAVKGDDGYYHVDTATGPYILADLFHGTAWNNDSIYSLYAAKIENDQKFLYDLDGKGVEDCTTLLLTYLDLATKSDFYGLVPVDETLQKLLDAITEEYSENHHAKEWLEVCKYYSRYGTEGEVPLPTLGLNPQTAIKITEGEFTFAPTRLIMPINYIMYEFKPTKSGVYLFHSKEKLDGGEQTQAWLSDWSGNALAYSGDDLLNSVADDDDGVNFCIYVYLTQGETYYLQCAFYWNDDSTIDKTFKFEVKYVGTQKTIITAAASAFFTTENEDMSGDIILASAINTKLVDGKYHYVDENGTVGGVVYIDVVNATRANDMMSLKEIANSSLGGKDEPKISPFNFTSSVYDKVLSAADRIDYTEKIKELIASYDETTGFVEATKELVAILKIYAKAYLLGVENAWLQFAYYEKEIKAPVTAPDTQTLYIENREEL